MTSTRSGRSRFISVDSNNCIKHLFDCCQWESSRIGPRYTVGVLFRDPPPRARWYILSVIVLGALVFCLFIPQATLAPVGPLIFLTVLSSLTSAFKVQFPIAS